MPADIKGISYGYEVGAYQPIDTRLILTKAQMLTAHEDFSLPDNYFAYCLDDNCWYEYSYAREEAGDFDDETGYYRQMPSGLVNDVIFNGESVVVDKIATLNAVEDVKVDGATVVEDGVANINLEDKQDKLTAGANIKIDNNVISVEGIPSVKEGYGILVGDDGTLSVNPDLIPSVDDIPTAMSEITNDMGFIDKSVLDLENYYLKSETYTQQEVNDLISSISGGVTLEVVAILPLSGDANKIYLVRREVGSNIYDQYVWFNNDWVQVGSTEVSLDDYYTKTEVQNLLANTQGKLTAGQGINLNNNYISVDISNNMTTDGNRIDVKQATPSQAGIAKYDDNTIKMNASGQLYAVNGGGSGGEYVAGPNIQISGNVISATDTTYRAGDGIKFTGDVISAKTDNETVFTNAQGEIAIQAVPIDEGNGIKISRDGVISIVPSEVADALDLSNYQEKLVAGDNITINGNVISSTGGGGGGGSTNWGSIGGTLSNQYDLANALAGKQKQLIAGQNITITDLSASQARIDATGGGSGSASFSTISGSPYDNIPLSNALASKKGVNDPVYANDVQGLAPVATSGDYNALNNKPIIGKGTLTIRQNGSVMGTFNADATDDKIIDLAAGGGGDINRYTVSYDTWSADKWNAMVAAYNNGAIIECTKGTTVFQLNIVESNQYKFQRFAIDPQIVRAGTRSEVILLKKDGTKFYDQFQMAPAWAFRVSDWGTNSFNKDTLALIKSHGAAVFVIDDNNPNAGFRNLWYSSSNQQLENSLLVSRCAGRQKNGKTHQGEMSIQFDYNSSNNTYTVTRKEQMWPLFEFNSSTGRLDIITY